MRQIFLAGVGSSNASLELAVDFLSATRWVFLMSRVKCEIESNVTHYGFNF